MSSRTCLTAKHDCICRRCFDEKREVVVSSVSSSSCSSYGYAAATGDEVNLDGA